MAALGNKLIQHATIELDPYAVLANGDPSQLEPSSKQLLLLKLQEVEETNPILEEAIFGEASVLQAFLQKILSRTLKHYLISKEMVSYVN